MASLLPENLSCEKVDDKSFSTKCSKTKNIILKKKRLIECDTYCLTLSHSLTRQSDVDEHLLGRNGNPTKG